MTRRQKIHRSHLKLAKIGGDKTRAAWAAASVSPGLARIAAIIAHPESPAIALDGKRKAWILYRMERIASLQIAKLPEGVYLATSDDIPGLVAQGRTIAETLEIARDVARKLLENFLNAR